MGKNMNNDIYRENKKVSSEVNNLLHNMNQETVSLHLKKKGFKNHRYALKVGVNWCHTCVCSVCQVMKHISADLCVCKLTSTCPPHECVTGRKILHIDLQHTTGNGGLEGFSE